MHKGKPPPPTPEQLPWIPPGNTFNRFAGKKNSKNLRLELGGADNIPEELEAATASYKEDEVETNAETNAETNEESGSRRKHRHKHKKKKKRKRDDKENDDTLMEERKEKRKRSKDTSVTNTITTSGVGTSVEDEETSDRNASKMSLEGGGHTNYPPGFVPSPTLALGQYATPTPFPSYVLPPPMGVPPMGVPPMGVSPTHQQAMSVGVSPQHQMLAQPASNGSWPSDYPYAQSPYGLRSMPMAPSRTTQQTGGPEAWLVFPKQEVIEEPHNENVETINNGGKRSVRSFTAKPINFASSIGSQFKRSYNNIHQRDTPVERFNLVEEGNNEEMAMRRREQRLKEREDNHKKSVQAAIATMVATALISIVALVIAFSLPDTQTEVAPSNVQPSEGSPCRTYTSLREGWRRLRSSRSEVGSQGNCDSDLSPGWYRFEGSAGRFMATSPPENEVCGTSVIGWMNGQHPKVREGVVRRDFCFFFNNNKCEYQLESRVQTCPDEDNQGQTFYVYNLRTPIRSRCNFAFCATTSDP